MDILKKIFGKKEEISDSDLKAALLKKATENMQSISMSSNTDDNVFVSKHMSALDNKEQAKKKIIRLVLLEIAEKGEVGILATSISDKTDLSMPNVSNALSYLTNNNYAEAVSSPTGKKYYLTDAGRKYCLSKEFNS